MLLGLTSPVMTSALLGGCLGGGEGDFNARLATSKVHGLLVRWLVFMAALTGSGPNVLAHVVL